MPGSIEKAFPAARFLATRERVTPPPKLQSAMFSSNVMNDRVIVIDSSLIVV